MEIKTLEIAGFASALQALRLPYGKECRSAIYNVNSYITLDWVDNFSDFRKNQVNYPSPIVRINEKDLALLQRLVKNGDEHAKVLRGVNVWFEINAERYFHVELDTYKVGAERLSSESTMHIQCKNLTEDELLKIKGSLAEGTMQRRVWMMNYQTLRRVYFQRRKHRLPQWRQFCEWIETLPLSKELITLEGGKQ